MKQIQNIKFNIDHYGASVLDKKGEAFGKIVEAIRPMQKYIKKVQENSDEHEFNRALHKIGDFITDFVANSKK